MPGLYRDPCGYYVAQPEGDVIHFTHTQLVHGVAVLCHPTVIPDLPPAALPTRWALLRAEAIKKEKEK